jgi:hypothetical protein
MTTMTAEQAVDKLNSEMATRSVKLSQPVMAQGADVLMQETTTMLPLIALMDMGVYYRVVGSVAYVNRSKRPQITLFIKDFDDLSEAEELFLSVWEYDGAMAFGKEIKISRGSGVRIGKIDLS